MYCRNCGKEVHEKAVACTACGVPPKIEKKFCPNCGTSTQPLQAMCTSCGVSLAKGPGGGATAGEKTKVAAGLLGIFLGSLGVHKFYLGYKKEGLIMLLVTLVGGIITCGVASGIVSIIGLVEGIIYITKTDEEFEQTYVQNRKGWF